MCLYICDLKLVKRFWKNAEITFLSFERVPRKANQYQRTNKVQTSIMHICWQNERIFRLIMNFPIWLKKSVHLNKIYYALYVRLKSVASVHLSLSHSYAFQCKLISRLLERNHNISTCQLSIRYLPNFNWNLPSLNFCSLDYISQ